jgi:hypothetical protein
MSKRLRSSVLALLAVASLAASASCGPPPDAGVLRVWTEDFEIRLLPDVVPPRALERITYTVTVIDKETREPVVNGEGRIFATNADRKTVWNGLTYGPEAGTYRTHITFVTAGDWAMGIQFRRDSTTALQRSEDWRQAVRNELPPSEEARISVPTVDPVTTPPNAPALDSTNKTP